MLFNENSFHSALCCCFYFVKNVCKFTLKKKSCDSSFLSFQEPHFRRFVTKLGFDLLKLDMENHRRIWHRFLSRLRDSRETRSYIPASGAGQRNFTGSSLAVDAYFPGRYSHIIRDHAMPQSRQGLAPQRSHSVISSFARLGHLDKLVSFIPKCLTGFNAQPILMGQISYDDFSHNCWLENHLHRFGGLSTEAVRCESNSNLIDSEYDAPSESESISSCSNNEMSAPPAANAQNNRNHNNMSTYSSSTGSNTSTNSSISDVTHLYLSGFAFDPDSMFLEAPPPYSEHHDDPPPPYSEVPDPASRRARSRNASNQGLHSHDILW